MAKVIVALLVMAVSSVFVCAQDLAEPPGKSDLDRSLAFRGSALTCVQPQTFQVPRSVADRAKVKARLINLLRESLYDDAKGVVNIAREKEIRKLASKLKRDD
ncbi:MAG TPA: hypothetical protein VND65_22645 [Candidatus Binatia bacterium]|nr:hypothetical protein [Candidatus Binatia bacterium]